MNTGTCRVYIYKVCQLFDARNGLIKRCYTCHPVELTLNSRCHVWHCFFFNLTPCLASKSWTILYLQFLTQLRRLTIRSLTTKHRPLSLTTRHRPLSLTTKHRPLFAGLNAMDLGWIVAEPRCGIEYKGLWTDLPDGNEVVAVVEGRTVARVGHQTVPLLTHRRIRAPGQLAFFCSLIVLASTGDLTVGELGPLAPLGWLAPLESSRTGHLHGGSMNTAEVGVAVPWVGFEVEATSTVHMAFLVHIFLR